jgi:PII-like signaling protein
MKGYQLTFFTLQDQKHAHHPLAEWLMLSARKLGIRGATVVAASESFGHDGRIHSAHFFELADQPQEILMAVTDEQATALFAFLRSEGVNIFYVKCPIEFGMSAET